MIASCSSYPYCFLRFAEKKISWFIGFLIAVATTCCAVVMKVWDIETKSLPASKKRLAVVSRAMILKFMSVYRFQFDLDMFEYFFGKSIFSIKRVFAVLVSTVMSFLFVTAMYGVFLPSANYQLFGAIRIYTRWMAEGAIGLFVVTLFIDIVSTQKTIFFIRASSGKIRMRIFFLLIDTILTPAFFLILFPIGYSLVSVVSMYGVNLPFDLNMPGGSTVHISSWFDYFFAGVRYNFNESSSYVVEFLSNISHGKIQATFLRIPVSLNGMNLADYVDTTGRYPVAGYAYPFLHSFLASFFIIIWMFVLIFGKIIAFIVRLIPRFMRRIYISASQDVAIREYPAVFLALTVAAISFFVIAAVATVVKIMK
ncbi:MAG: hypothetical protein PW843_01110 [Azospirillaceae bacterium]|nr:hypothetical protein [Azospirillaceae bacterium]